MTVHKSQGQSTKAGLHFGPKRPLPEQKAPLGCSYFALETDTLIYIEYHTTSIQLMQELAAMKNLTIAEIVQFNLCMCM